MHTSWARGEVSTDEHVAQFHVTVESLGDGDDPLVACGGADAIKANVEKRLGRRVFTDRDDADSTLLVGIERAPRGPDWHAHIAEQDRSGKDLGHRHVAVHAQECAKGVDAIAVILAIMIGPPRIVRASEPAGEPAPPPEPPVRPQRPRPVPPPTEELPRREPWRFAPVAEISAGSGVLPGLSWGVNGGVVVEPPFRHLVFFLARAHYSPARSTGTDPEAHFDRLTATVFGCHEFLQRASHRRLLMLALCGGVELGRLHGDAPSLSIGAKSSLLLDLPIEGRLALPLHPSRNLSLEPVVFAQAAAILRRDRFTYQDRAGVERTLHRAAPVGVQGGIGLAVHFL